MDKLTGTIQGVGGISGSLSASGGLSGGISLPEVAPLDPYDGEYVITPGRTEQVLNIDGKRATADIIVQAIPSNYGLITWNGSTITVS